MSKIFGYAICDNKIIQVLHGSKAVWYDDVGNRRVEDVKYIDADNWEQAKEFIRQREFVVGVSKTETITPSKTVTNCNGLNMAECRSALEAIADSMADESEAAK